MDGHADMEGGYRHQEAMEAMMHQHHPHPQIVKYGVDGQTYSQGHGHNSTGVPSSPSDSGGGQRKLVLVVILLSILCFGLIAYILVTGPLAGFLLPGFGEFVGMCDTPECVGISHRSVESGDFSQDPCEDFYSFACSTWQQQNPTSQEQLYSAANINLIRDRVDFYIKRLLEKPGEMGVNGTTQFHMYSSPKAFYESCLHFNPPEDSKIISQLMEPLGGYLKPGWSDANFDLTSIVLAFLRVNAAPLFDLTLDIDPRDRTKYALVVELPRSTSLVPNLIQPRSRQEDVLLSEKLNAELTEASGNGFHLNTSGIDAPHNGSELYSSTLDRQVLYKMITDNLEIKRVEKLHILTQQLGKMLQMSDESIEEDARAIAGFASAIEKIKPSHRSRKFWKQQNKVYNAFTIDSLQRLFGNVDWKQLLEGLLGHRNKGHREKSESEGFSWEKAVIYVPYPDYLRRLSQTILFWDKRIVVNGMMIMYLKDMLNDISPKKKDEDPRWKFCVHSTKSVFALEISSLYMRSFDPDFLRRMKNDVEDIFSSIKDTLLQFLNQSYWQDTSSREESIKKIKSLKGNFIGPDFYLKSDYIEDQVKNEIKVQIDPKNFIGNVQVVYKIFRKQLYALYLKPIDIERTIWSFVTFPTTVNAFYIQQFNSLVVPLAFLNPPHYIYGAPKYINFATIALTIAHEALHSLDSSGSHFDADGKLHSGSHGEQRGFLKEKSSCVAKQYFDKFRKIIPFHHSNVNMYFQVDGNLTQNENLADIAGLQVALKAYHKYLATTNSPLEKMRLPGMKFSRDQMYFLTVAQAYCANISPMGYIFLLEMDEHTPHPERINGMLMNIPEFGKAFKCSAESKMNPTAKCSLW